MISKHLRGDVNFRLARLPDRRDLPEGRCRDHLPGRKERPRQAGGARARVPRISSQSVRCCRFTAAFIDDVILPHETRRRLCPRSRFARKRLENPWRSTATASYYACSQQNPDRAQSRRYRLPRDHEPRSVGIRTWPCIPRPTATRRPRGAGRRGRVESCRRRPGSP